MKNTIKLILCLMICLSTALALVACGGDDDNADKGFKEGYAVEYMIKSEIKIADLVDDRGAGYTLFAEKEGEQPIDLSKEKSWYPLSVGDWTLKLNILGGENKGNYSLGIKVLAPAINISFKESTVSFKSGKEITFEEMIEKLDISSNFEEYGKVTKRIYSIGEYAKEPVKFTTETSYTFPKSGSYAIIFGVEAEDGQFYKMIKKVKVN